MKPNFTLADRKKQYDQIVAMAQIGLSQPAIARALKVTQPLVWYYLNKSSHARGSVMA